MELHLFVNQERENLFLAWQSGHGFHTRPYNFHIEILRSAEIRLVSLCLTSHQQLIKSWRQGHDLEPCTTEWRDVTR